MESAAVPCPYFCVEYSESPMEYSLQMEICFLEITYFFVPRTSLYVTPGLFEHPYTFSIF